MSVTRLLIVDDERGISQVVGRILSGTGRYEVLVENEPAAALQAAQSFKPDVLLMDLIMPKFDGHELLATLRQLPEMAKVPAAIFTSTVPERDMQSGVPRRNGEFYMAKTVNVELLERCLAEILGSSG